jgi:hypothetical protein
LVFSGRFFKKRAPFGHCRDRPDHLLHTLKEGLIMRRETAK